MPLIGMVVAPSLAAAVAAEWAVPPAMADRVSLVPTAAPVCLAWLLPGLADDVAAAHWLGDYERCLASAGLRAGDVGPRLRGVRP